MMLGQEPLQPETDERAAEHTGSTDHPDRRQNHRDATGNWKARLTRAASRSARRPAAWCDACRRGPEAFRADPVRRRWASQTEHCGSPRSRSLLQVVAGYGRALVGWTVGPTLRLTAGTDDRRRACAVSAAQRQGPFGRSASSSRPSDSPAVQRWFLAPRCRRSDPDQSPCLSGPAASP